MEEYCSPSVYLSKKFSLFPPLWTLQEDLNSLSLNSSICKITILIIKHFQSLHNVLSTEYNMQKDIVCAL